MAHYDDGDTQAQLSEEHAQYLTRLRNENIQLTADLTEARAEVREWLCEECHTVYPGPPAKGASCVICPQCGGATGPRTAMELRRTKRDLAEARHDLQVERQANGLNLESAIAAHEHAEQLERDLAEARGERDDYCQGYKGINATLQDTLRSLTESRTDLAEARRSAEANIDQYHKACDRADRAWVCTVAYEKMKQDLAEELALGEQLAAACHAAKRAFLAWSMNEANADGFPDALADLNKVLATDAAREVLAEREQEQEAAKALIALDYFYTFGAQEQHGPRLAAAEDRARKAVDALAAQQENRGE